MTTIGILRICTAKSSAAASVFGSVSSPEMISSSCILSTGEKKCRPMKSPVRSTWEASSVIGRVEVFEPRIVVFGTAASISAWTLCFRSVFSKTASMTRSTSDRSS